MENGKWRVADFGHSPLSLIMIVLECISFAYPEHDPVFENLNWEVARGEAWAVLGPSGCGKTTLLYLLAGLRLPTSGVIRIDDQEQTGPRPRTGLILQDYGLLPWATAQKNIMLGLQHPAFLRSRRQTRPGR